MKFFCALPLWAQSTARSPLASLTVLPFSMNADTEKTRQEAIIVRNLVESQMILSQKYHLISYEELERVLQDQHIQLNNFSNSENIQNLQKHNINYIVTGSIDLIGANYYVMTIKIFDVMLGRFLYSDDGFIESTPRDLYNGVKTLAVNFIGGIPAGEQAPGQAIPARFVQPELIAQKEQPGKTELPVKAVQPEQAVPKEQSIQPVGKTEQAVPVRAQPEPVAQKDMPLVGQEVSVKPSVTPLVKPAQPVGQPIGPKDLLPVQLTPVEVPVSGNSNAIYTIGGIGPGGGIIFYDKGRYSDGWRYLEAAPSETECLAEWGAFRIDVGSTRSEVGAGKQNTQLILEMLQRLGETGRAAQLCATLTAGGYQDWFFPSKDELSWMYTNLKIRNLGSFQNDYYWSSSQNNPSSVWYQRFDDGIQYGSIKSKNFRIRAVRFF